MTLVNHYCCFRPSRGGGIRLIWDVTGTCNLSCLHCQASSAASRRGKGATEDVPLGRCLGLLEELKGLFVEKITFSGGEPLLRAGIHVLLRRSRELGFSVELLSNLTLAGRSLSKLASVVDEFTTSLDGATEETHDWFRQASGAFSSTIECLRELGKLGRPRRIISIVHSRNAAEVGSLINLVGELGCTSILFVYPKLAGRVLENRHILPSADQIAVALDHIERASQEWAGRLQVSLSRFPGRLEGPLGKCKAADRVMYIDCQGRVHPCQHYLVNVGISMNSARYQSLPTIWNSRLFSEIRSKLNGLPPVRCALEDECRRGCRPFHTGQGDRLGDCDPFCVLSKEA